MSKTKTKWNRSTGCPTHPFSLVVCRHPLSKKWLAVEENNNRGWWLPGGFVENTDTHFTAAIRETEEEAGIKVKLMGILRIENSMNKYGARQRVLFFAEPEDPDQAPKSISDAESKGAAWMSVEELEQKAGIPPPEGLRGRELLEWAKYIERGGQIFPLHVLAEEHDPIAMPE